MNTLLVMIDDLFSLSAWPIFNTILQTPNLDALKQTSHNFDNAYADVALCNPSRATILTGQTPWETGVVSNRNKLFDVVDPADTLPGRLLDSGMHVALGGKIFHDLPDDVSTVSTEILSAVGHRNGAVAGSKLIANIDYGASGNTTLSDTTLTNSVDNFLNGYSGTAPFFLAAGIYRPHIDWVVPQEFIDLYDIRDIPVPAFVDDSERSEFAKALQNFDLQGLVDDQGVWPDLIRHYLASVSYADHLLGEMLASLDTSVHAGTTNVIVTSDHGYHLGDASTWHKFTLYEQSARAPLIIREAGQTQGQTIDTPVNLSSIFSTVLDLNGLNVPPDRSPSLLPLINGAQSDPDAAALTWMEGSYSIRTETHRYTRYEDGSEELWDMDADPFQQNNLVTEPAHAALLSELRSLAVDRLGISTTPSNDDDLLIAPQNDISGGTGDDIYILDRDDIRITEAAGAGNDTIIYASDFSLPDHVENFVAKDRIALFATGDVTRAVTVFGNGLNNSINASVANDILWGLDGNDAIFGFLGDDYLSGGNGADSLNGDRGEDTVDGGSGDDILIGQNDDDVLFGGSGEDDLNGNAGNDQLYGGDGDDLLSGSGGDDILRGGSGIDRLVGASGNDRLFGDKGNDTLLGTVGENYLDGGSGEDRLIGGVGNDVLSGGADADFLNGGAGRDRASYATSLGAVVVNLSAGIVQGGDAQGDFITAIEDLEGSRGDDLLTGNGSSNTLLGLAGADTLNGGWGNDTLEGGAGADVLMGGAGRDLSSYLTSAGGVIVNLTTGASLGGDAQGDTLSNIEDLEGSEHADTLTGDNRANMLLGLDGSDTLNGGAGKDFLAGGAGADILIGGTGVDRASYVTSLIGINIDLISGTATGGEAEGDTLSHIEEIEGTNFDDVLTGDGMDNTLLGLAGDDILTGGIGADILVGGAGRDRASYATSVAGVDVDLAHSSATGGDAAGDSLSEIEEIEGSAQGDMLTGDGANNTLLGLNGNDTLNGGGGDDVLSGGVGQDVIDGGSGIDRATYATSASGVTVNLATGQTDGGEATGDLLTLIENIEGSEHRDALTGDGQDNKLLGLAGRDTLDGGAGNDTLSGGEGQDILIGGSGRDRATYATSSDGVTINLATGLSNGADASGDTLSEIEELEGSAFDDLLIGDANDNTLLGRAGNDTFDGGAGADIINGGAGQDRVTYATSASGVTVDLDYGIALGGDAAGDTLSEIEEVTGSTHNDTLTGTVGDNVLLGLEGADIIDGIAGTNFLAGGAGTDTLNGGAGKDLLSGGSGADALIGGAGSDRATYATSSTGVTVNLAGGTAVGGDAQGDTLSGIEEIEGSEQSDALTGDKEDNILLGLAGADTLSGGSGDDILEGGIGADILTGGLDIDLASYETSAVRVFVNLTSGLAIGGDAGGDTFSSIENLLGSAHNDALTGDGFDNRLFGGDGDDILTGFAGDDILFGGLGADRLVGGPGYDQASFEESAEGVTINLSTGASTGGEAEGDTFSKIEEIVGSDFDDFLTGDADANTFRGTAGDDVLAGGAGADTLEGGQGQDRASYATSSAGVTVDLFGRIARGGDAEGDILSRIEEVEGSQHDDVLSGDHHVNTLLGLGGDDILSGGTRADTLIGGAGQDRASYASSSSYVIVDLAIGIAEGGDAEGDILSEIEDLEGSQLDDTLTGDGSNNMLFGLLGNDILSGGGGDDVLTGFRGADALVGGDGSDILKGGRDNDTLTGGTGNDFFHFYGASGSDVITDFEDGTDFLVITDPNGDLIISDIAGDASVQIGTRQILVLNAAGEIDNNDIIII